MPPKKTNKLLNLVPTEEIVEKPKKTLAQLKAEMMRDPKFKAHNNIKLGSELSKLKVISSGILRLDYELGIGGFPRGKIVQLYGSESSWKSTICLRAIAEVQKMGGEALWIDAEHSYDQTWATAHGVDENHIHVMDPDTMEDALNTIEVYAKGGIDIIVLDSLAAIAPHKEKYANENKTEFQPIDKEGMALAARLWAKWARQGPGYIAKNDVLFLIVNQLRSSLSPYGSPTAVPGGKAVKHMNSITLNMKRDTSKDGQITHATDKKRIVGAKYDFTIDKTRYGIIGNGGSFIVRGTTVDNITTLRDIGILEGIIQKVNASNYMVGDEKINGQDNVRDYLLQNAQAAADLEQKVRELMTKRAANSILENAEAVAEQNARILALIESDVDSDNDTEVSEEE